MVYRADKVALTYECMKLIVMRGKDGMNRLKRVLKRIKAAEERRVVAAFRPFISAYLLRKKGQGFLSRTTTRVKTLTSVSLANHVPTAVQGPSIRPKPRPSHRQDLGLKHRELMFSVFHDEQIYRLPTLEDTLTVAKACSVAKIAEPEIMLIIRLDLDAYTKDGNWRNSKSPRTSSTIVVIISMS
ncbi:hypothetical protein BDD12DRAFT_978925 [Trichophaea hybrida]|nr:hypothetical protein BDD12DRAFT_978925 [Trichophaea hybrida]